MNLNELYILTNEISNYKGIEIINIAECIFLLELKYQNNDYILSILNKIKYFISQFTNLDFLTKKMIEDYYEATNSLFYLYNDVKFLRDYAILFNYLSPYNNTINKLYSYMINNNKNEIQNSLKNKAFEHISIIYDIDKEQDTTKIEKISQEYIDKIKSLEHKNIDISKIENIINDINQLPDVLNRILNIESSIESIKNITSPDISNKLINIESAIDNIINDTFKKINDDITDVNENIQSITSQLEQNTYTTDEINKLLNELNDTLINKKNEIANDILNIINNKYGNLFDIMNAQYDHYNNIITSRIDQINNFDIRNLIKDRINTLLLEENILNDQLLTSTKFFTILSNIVQTIIDEYFESKSMQELLYTAISNFTTTDEFTNLLNNSIKNIIEPRLSNHKVQIMTLIDQQNDEISDLNNQIQLMKSNITKDITEFKKSIENITTSIDINKINTDINNIKNFINLADEDLININMRDYFDDIFSEYINSIILKFNLNPSTFSNLSVEQKINLLFEIHQQKINDILIKILNVETKLDNKLENDIELTKQSLVVINEMIMHIEQYIYKGLIPSGYNRVLSTTMDNINNLSELLNKLSFSLSALDDRVSRIEKGESIPSSSPTTPSKLATRPLSFTIPITITDEEINKLRDDIQLLRDNLTYLQNKLNDILTVSGQVMNETAGNNTYLAYLYEYPTNYFNVDPYNTVNNDILFNIYKKFMIKYYFNEKSNLDFKNKSILRLCYNKIINKYNNKKNFYILIKNIKCEIEEIILKPYYYYKTIKYHIKILNDVKLNFILNYMKRLIKKYILISDYRMINNKSIEIKNFIINKLIINTIKLEIIYEYIIYISLSYSGCYLKIDEIEQLGYMILNDFIYTMFLFKLGILLNKECLFNHESDILDVRKLFYIDFIKLNHYEKEYYIKILEIKYKIYKLYIKYLIQDKYEKKLAENNINYLLSCYILFNNGIGI
ncbi:prominin [Alphaentomopoxvirus acuprea]|uniref:Prominin n=1 Tax=Alphaentomopoxvirus acuprea TaxID=62099 RepID=W6JPL6_9POXV|nr:prominin [Anomala cuprea entomopoxvirus]BAO49494.1 prominin [Anomala cuprea entomopoxvirus]